MQRMQRQRSSQHAPMPIFHKQMLLQLHLISLAGWKRCNSCLGFNVMLDPPLADAMLASM